MDKKDSLPASDIAVPAFDAFRLCLDRAGGQEPPTVRTHDPAARSQASSHFRWTLGGIELLEWIANVQASVKGEIPLLPPLLKGDERGICS